MALQAACLCPIGLDKVVQAQVQLWTAVRDVGNDLSQRKLLLHPNSVLVGLIVAVQQLDVAEKGTTLQQDQILLQLNW